MNLEISVTAVDGDRGINNPVQYAISASNIDNDVDLFTIEKHTGIVRTTKLLDRELMSPFSGAYILQITVRLSTVSSSLNLNCGFPFRQQK